MKHAQGSAIALLLAAFQGVDVRLTSIVQREQAFQCQFNAQTAFERDSQSLLLAMPPNVVLFAVDRLAKRHAALKPSFLAMVNTIGFEQLAL